MMGYQPGFQPKLFYHQINLEQRVPQGHLLRKIQEKIDFDFIYAEVKDTYGDNGNVSIPPPVIPNTGVMAETVVGDSKYGTIDNFLACHDLGVQAHIPDLGECSAKRKEKLKIFSEDRFEYDPQSDTYRCPAGNQLKPKSFHLGRQSRDYAAPKKICAACDLREQCTKNKSGRTVKRHLRQEELDRMREASRSAKAKRDIKTRQHLMERSFARGTPYGYDRARWRGLWRVQIQEYLISAIQNIQVLLKYGDQPKKCISVVVNQVKGTLPGVIRSVSDRMKGLMITEMNRIISTGFVSTVYIKG